MTPIRTLILSGGVAHDYATTSPMLVDILSEAGIVAEMTDKLADLARPDLHEFDVLTLNCVRWPTEWATGPDGPYQLGEAERRTVLDFLASGNGLVALHAATINFDDWPAYREIVGGYWEWNVTGHGPYQPGWAMHIVDREHPITRDIEDFSIHDELYHTLTITRHVHTLMTTLWDGRLQPMAWTTTYGPARVHYNALGHGPDTFRCEPFRRMLQQGVRWAAGKKR
ncbi:MAG: ThuA domain-containing protein [Candidatus Latescibacteria bacterium]|nr:ThuA domain-containing protein [Candidatus Latescibacterota bacterium]